MALVSKRTPSHILALPLLCSLSTSSKRSRVELYRHDGVSFFVQLLVSGVSTTWQVKYPTGTATAQIRMQVRVLEALAACAMSDGKGVEKIISEEQNIAVLVDVFADSPLSSPHFLEPYTQMLADTNLEHLNRALGQSSLVQSVSTRLQGREKDPHARLKLMKILKSLYAGHENAKVGVLVVAVKLSCWLRR